jgi:O-antigen/teichoic acid export membrane protein
MQHFLIAKNTLYQIFTRGTTSLVGFLITIIIARKFGVLGYGDFTKATSYIALSYLILDFGLNAFFLQYDNPKFKTLFYLRILISLIVFVAINLIVLILPYNSSLGTGFSGNVRVEIFIFSFSIFAQSIILSATAIFQKSINYFRYMIGIIIGSLVNLVLVLLFTFLNFSIFFILFAFTASSITSALLLIKLTRESIWPLSFDRAFAKEIFIKSFPIGLMLIFNLIYFRVDMFLLSLLAPTKDVGIYGLSYKFFDFLIALPLFLSNAIYPFLIKAKKEGKDFLSLTKNYFFVFLITSFIIIIPFWFISPLFNLIKTDFADSIIPFRILLLSLPFFFTTSFLQWILITLDRQKYLMYVYLFSTILNILLNIIFIPQFSYIASATITLASEALVFMLLIGKVLTTRNLLERKT